MFLKSAVSQVEQVSNVGLQTQGCAPGSILKSTYTIWKQCRVHHWEQRRIVKLVHRTCSRSKSIRRFCSLYICNDHVLKYINGSRLRCMRYWFHRLAKIIPRSQSISCVGGQYMFYMEWQYLELCLLSQIRAARTFSWRTMRGLAFSLIHSGVGGFEPTNNTQIGVVISSMVGGKVAAMSFTG